MKYTIKLFVPVLVLAVALGMSAFSHAQPAPATLTIDCSPCLVGESMTLHGSGYPANKDIAVAIRVQGAYNDYNVVPNCATNGNGDLICLSFTEPAGDYTVTTYRYFPNGGGSSQPLASLSIYRAVREAKR